MPRFVLKKTVTAAEQRNMILFLLQEKFHSEDRMD